MRNPGGSQWSFSNKVSAVPQFLSFQTAPEEKPRRNIYDPIASSNYMSVSGADTYDSSTKRGPAVRQKHWYNDREAGCHRVMAARPVQHIEAFPVGSNKDIRMFPFSNQKSQQVPVSLSTPPTLHSHFTSSAQSGFRNSITIQQQQRPLGGVPITAPISAVPATTSSVIGTTELSRNSPKFSGSPTQLTIFYNGSVCVYDDISPEKALAIMSMARSGSPPVPVVHNKASSTAVLKMQSEIRSPTLSLDHHHHHHLVGNKSINNPAGSSMPSAISVSSSTSSESGTTKSLVGSSSISHAEPSSSSKQITSSVPASAANILAPSAIAAGLPQVRIPQARKASLARFLEKRKERVTSSSPYAMGKKSGEGDVCA